MSSLIGFDGTAKQPAQRPSVDDVAARARALSLAAFPAFWAGVRAVHSAKEMRELSDSEQTIRTNRERHVVAIENALSRGYLIDEIPEFYSWLSWTDKRLS